MGNKKLFSKILIYFPNATTLYPGSNWVTNGEWIASQKYLICCPKVALLCPGRKWEANEKQQTLKIIPSAPYKLPSYSPSQVGSKWETFEVEKKFICSQQTAQLLPVTIGQQMRNIQGWKEVHLLPINCPIAPCHNGAVNEKQLVFRKSKDKANKQKSLKFLSFFVGPP